ncbi:hypothetical protein BGZ65_001138 [Modicella reniformis]|uniref:Uncharacterized protein n=1 Tax=Modicella reniformis TaxID=1440133 RepID=A0A9P6IM65_9FUNG|nr:hypothetical protein BGZ65_001138 [Modicella reniformis]
MPFELQQEVLPIQLPMQPLNMSRRRASRSTVGVAAAAAAPESSNETSDNATVAVAINDVGNNKASGPATESGSYTVHPTSAPEAGGNESSSYTSPLAWLSRVITKAGQEERLHYHANGHHHHNRSHHHAHGYQPLHHSHSHHHQDPSVPLQKQLFSKATVVTLEKKYATVHWAAEFYCTITSPCFALPVLLYFDPAFRWSAPDIHITHFAIFLSVFTALTSTLYHATLFKIFSSMDACFATIMFYMNTIQLLRSLPDPYAMMIPDLISTIVHWEWTPYLLTIAMLTLFIVSWKRTAMLSLLLMVLMIPASIWGFVVHESWQGLGFGLIGLSMFAADRFKLFCGHSYWHLAGGLSLWYGIATGALAK